MEWDTTTTLRVTNMLSSQLIYMLPLTILIVILSVFFAFLLIKTKMNYYVKFLGIPLLVFTSIFAYKFLDSSLGYAYPADIPGKFVLLGAEVVDVKHEKNIELWIRQDASRTRLLKLPYSKEMIQKIWDAQEQAHGRPLVGEFKDGKGDIGDFVTNFKFYPFNVYEAMPKGDPPKPNIR